MAFCICKSCGGNLQVEENVTVGTCEFCGTTQTLPLANDDKKMTLFVRANRLRFSCEFDKASGVYESIVAEFPEEAEAYWGLILCKFGIEYVDDPKTGKKIPTCHRTSFENVLEDPDFDMVMENASPMSKKLYREEAKRIEELRRDIVETSSKEDPYDIFICYKETDPNGERTVDSLIAQDVYDALTERGYRVFFARVTLEDKLGQMYEPYIFSALQSAKIMLAFGTDYEYYNAVWVKNEWSRFLQLIEKGEKKTLIPCYKNIDAYDIPKEFTKLQAQDMGKVGAIQDLLRGIEKILPRGEKSAAKSGASAGAGESIQSESFTELANGFLRERDFKSAGIYFDLALRLTPTNPEATLGKLLAEVQASSIGELRNLLTPIDDLESYKNAYRCANEATRKELAEAAEEIEKQLQQRKEARAKRMKTLKKWTFIGSTAAVVLALLIIFVVIPFTAMANGNYRVYVNTYNVKELTIKDGVTEIRASAFEGCESLQSVVIPNSVTSIGKDAFKGCDSLTSVTISASVEKIDENAFENLDKINFTVVGKEELSAADISALLNYGVKKFTIGDGVTSIGYRAFDGCSSLTSITIGNGVTSISDRAFYNCDSLTSITIGDSVTSIGNDAFSGCSSLTSITIGDSVASIGEGAFYDCDSLTSVTIGNGATSIGEGAFYDCDALTSITIPDSVTSIDNTAFHGCSSLTSITIPSSVTSIGSYAFSGCGSLTTVYYGGTKSDWDKISIDSYNNSLQNAIRYYYSETRPTTAGGYWHYVNGVPTAW